MPDQAWWCEQAWIDDTCRSGVLVTARDGIITAVTADAEPGTAQRLAGLVIPGFANCHSHAFHRVLRARTQRGAGSFWTWREQMYAAAHRLDPDSYFALARAVYGEMALAGITSVGEFHYVHHQRDGTPYDDPNAMGHALIAAARDAGVRITLLDTCYLSSGFGAELEGPQRRFGDGDVDRWATRVDALRGTPSAIIGAAVHSVRAVDPDQIAVIAEWTRRRRFPLHAHLSEQIAENEQCLAAYGCTPTQVLADAGVLGRRFSAVHATHLTGSDIALLGSSASSACFCPTTERDLADGIGPARDLVTAGSPLTLGSDSHAIIDMSEEARAVELNTRLATHARGHFTAAELLRAATADGHASIGWPDAGLIAVGRRADLVAIDAGSVRTAGFDSDSAAETAIFAATSADITDVIIDGATVVMDRRHRMGDVAHALDSSISALIAPTREAAR